MVEFDDGAGSLVPPFLQKMEEDCISLLPKMEDMNYTFEAIHDPADGTDNMNYTFQAIHKHASCSASMCKTVSVCVGLRPRYSPSIHCSHGQAAALRFVRTIADLPDLIRPNIAAMALEIIVVIEGGSSVLARLVEAKSMKRKEWQKMHQFAQETASKFSDIFENFLSYKLRFDVSCVSDILEANLHRRKQRSQKDS